MIWAGVIGTILVVGLFSHRYAWWRSAISNRYPRILMYHMVREPRVKARFNKLRVTPACFEAQVRWLSEQGYYFARMSELENSEALPTKTVVLTFDDGYEDNLIHADPVLQRYGACATLYLVVDRFERDWSSSKKAHHDDGELMREPKLTDQQVSDMLSSGRWELGGHTLTHANLSRLDRTQRFAEIAGGKRQLEERFGVYISSFAYPFGIYDDEDVELVRQAGFKSAVTTDEGVDTEVSMNRFRLRRVKVSGKDGRLAFRIRMRTGTRG